MSIRRLRLSVAALFLGLAVPSFVLIQQGFGRLELDAFRQQQLLAEAYVNRIDRELAASIAAEEARPFTDYSFAFAVPGAAADTVQRSALSVLPPPRGVPGTLGYFQVDADGRLTTPLLPADPAAAATAGWSEAERTARLARECWPRTASFGSGRRFDLNSKRRKPRPLPKPKLKLKPRLRLKLKLKPRRQPRLEPSPSAARVSPSDAGKRNPRLWPQPPGPPPRQRPPRWQRR
jgi:hypothetical protein